MEFFHIVKFVPQDHLRRKRERVVDLSFIREVQVNVAYRCWKEN